MTLRRDLLPHQIQINEQRLTDAPSSHAPVYHTSVSKDYAFVV